MRRADRRTCLVSHLGRTPRPRRATCREPRTCVPSAVRGSLKPLNTCESRIRVDLGHERSLQTRTLSGSAMPDQRGILNRWFKPTTTTSARTVSARSRSWSAAMARRRPRGRRQASGRVAGRVASGPLSSLEFFTLLPFLYPRLTRTLVLGWVLGATRGCCRSRGGYLGGDDPALVGDFLASSWRLPPSGREEQPLGWPLGIRRQ